MGKIISKTFIVIIALFLLTITGTAYAQIDNPGWNMDSNMYVGWSYGTDLNGYLTGTGLFDIINVGSETRTEFWWTTADLLSLTAPTGWAYTYDNGTDLVKLVGQSDDLGGSESITVPFTFNPANKELGYGNLDYFGPVTAGTLQDIGEVKVVPEPVSSILFLTGGAVFGARRYLKRKRLSS